MVERHTVRVRYCFGHKNLHQRCVLCLRVCRGLVVCMVECQVRVPGLKSRPGQKSGSRFLLHLHLLAPSQLSYDEYTVSGQMRQRGRGLAAALIFRGYENEAASISYPWLP